MKISLTFLCAVAFCASASAQTNTGTIKGLVRVTGVPQGNPIIRMGVDPMCSQMNAGKRVIQETVSADEHGGLANVFVRLRGNFPATPVPSQPLTIDQRACVFSPRVVGVRVGQTLQVRNGDPIAHSVHSISKLGNTFDVTMPSGSPPFAFRPKQEEVMLRVSCDLHKWMTTYVGVVTNPYFAVSEKGGAFQIDKVPAGTYTIEAWQEVYGVVTKTVKVTAGTTAMAAFTYSESERLSPRGR